MLFTVRGDDLVPLPPDDDRQRDGKTWLSLDQAEERSGLSRDDLRTLWYRQRPVYMQPDPRRGLVRDGKTFDPNGREIRVGCLVVEPHGSGDLKTVGRVVAVDSGVLLVRALPPACSARSMAGTLTTYTDAEDVLVLEDPPPPWPELPYANLLTRELVHMSTRLAEFCAELHDAAGRTTGDDEKELEKAERHVWDAARVLWGLARYHLLPHRYPHGLADAVEADDTCDEEPADRTDTAAEPAATTPTNGDNA
jgi:hypothetical protein